MMTSKIEEYLKLLNSVDNPDIKTIFVRLFELKRYKELIDFTNKWQKSDFEKCIEAIKVVIDRFHTNLQKDPHNSVIEFHSFLNRINRIQSDRVLDAVLEILFQFPLDVTFLESLGIAKVDQFLKTKAQIEDGLFRKQFPSDLSPEQIKACVLLARRKHNQKEFLEAAKIYIDLGCRGGDPVDVIPLKERLSYLENNALNECLNVRSTLAIKEIQSKIELLKFQYSLMVRIQDENDPTLKKLRMRALTDEELLEAITTHPVFRADLQVAEELLEITKQPQE
eukprot:g7176.t1